MFRQRRRTGGGRAADGHKTIRHKIEGQEVTFKGWIDCRRGKIVTPIRDDKGGRIYIQGSSKSKKMSVMLMLSIMVRT